MKRREHPEFGQFARRLSPELSPTSLSVSVSEPTTKDTAAARAGCTLRPVRRGRSILTCAASLACAGSAAVTLIGIAAQAKPPAPPDTPSARSEQVIRVGVDLVQVDATVTDRAGRHVSDLSADDFEILQDGRPQRISTFAYHIDTNDLTFTAGSDGTRSGEIETMLLGEFRLIEPASHISDARACNSS